MNDATTIAALLAPVLDANPVTASMELTFDDITVSVSSNAPELIAKLADYYRDFLGGGGAVRLAVTAIEAEPAALPLDFTVKERDPGKIKFKEAYADLPDGRVVRKLLTGFKTLWCNSGVNCGFRSA